MDNFCVFLSRKFADHTAYMDIAVRKRPLNLITHSITAEIVMYDQ